MHELAYTCRRAPPAGGSFRHNTALNSRQGQQLWQRSESSSVRVPGTRGTAPGRPMELHPAAQSSDQASSGSGGKMGGVAAVNRTLLLELMHEDDVSGVCGIFWCITRCCVGHGVLFASCSLAGQARFRPQCNAWHASIMSCGIRTFPAKQPIMPLYSEGTQASCQWMNWQAKYCLCYTRNLAEMRIAAGSHS